MPKSLMMYGTEGTGGVASSSNLLVSYINKFYYVHHHAHDACENLICSGLSQLHHSYVNLDLCKLFLLCTALICHYWVNLDKNMLSINYLGMQDLQVVQIMSYCVFDTIMSYKSRRTLKDMEMLVPWMIM